MATIEDVAEKAGVSVATVSRVLNNNYMVSNEKKNRVFEAVKALNYQPNALGRNLRRSETKMVLVICTVVIDEAMAGIQDIAKELGYDVILSYTGNKRDGMCSIKFLENSLVDGVILLNMLFKDEELLTISEKYPVVQCGEYVDIPNSFLVATNDQKAAYEMTSHLIQLGRKRIGFVAYEEFGITSHFSLEREKGYKQALADHGIPYDPELKKIGDFSYESGIDAAKQFLSMKEKPDAVFCTQDNMAVGCVNTFKNAGVSVPEDIAVSGFDNVELAEICNPSLTTVNQSFYEIGRETMRLLVSLIKGEITIGRQVLINHQLIIRDSTVKNKTK
jgi:LacI family transcriptional regulator, repressor for deo operon, udp, cdd, tsx, nupC, and nupG